MKIRKAIKSIVAVGTGLTMLGATVFGAAATTDLGAYPSQFIEEGEFDGLMVVGETASTDDVLGVVDIATSLQYSARGVAEDETETVIEGDAFRFETSAESLTLNKGLVDVESRIDSNDVEILESSNVRAKKSTDVNQYIYFDEEDGYSNSSLSVVFEQNDARRAEVVADYLKAEDGEVLFTYELDFEDGLESDIDTDNDELEDLRDVELSILGTQYSISEGYMHDEDDVELTLMGGSLTDSMEAGETKTFEMDEENYEVSVVIVVPADSTSGDEPATKLMINGEVTDRLEEGETYTLSDGTVIGIRDILAGGTGSGQTEMVSFYLGAHKVELDSSTNNVEIGEERVRDVSVKIDASESDNVGTINTITYNVEADDDFFIPAGSSLREFMEEPEALLSEAWDIKYAGLTKPSTEEVSLRASGDEAYNLEFVSRENKEYSVPLVEVAEDDAGDNIFHIGTEDEDLIYQEVDVDGDENNMTGVYYNATINATPIDSDFIAVDDYFIVGRSSDSNRADTADTRVYRVDDIDYDEYDQDGEVVISDEATGSTTTLKYSDVNFTGDANCTTTDRELSADREHEMYVCGNGNGEDVNESSLRIAVDLNGDEDFNGDNVAITTANSGIIDLSHNSTTMNLSLKIDESYTDSEVDEYVNFSIEQQSGSDDDEVDIVDVDGTELDLNSDHGSDDQQGMIPYGIHVYQRDRNGADELTLTIPSEQVEANVYVTGDVVTSEVAKESEGEVQRIQVGRSVLDSEITDIEADNLIVVGGPCVNTVAAELLDIPGPGTEECYEEFPVPEGQGIIKMVENGDNVALIVAGYSAADTRNAAQIVANYDDNEEELEGEDEVVVTGTDVSVPVAEPEEEPEEEEVEDDEEEAEADEDEEAEDQE